jgi:retron-type reverse transcriptase
VKRYGKLWPQITAFDNLYLAYRKARRGKQRKLAVARFSLNLEQELLDLQAELLAGSYQPGEYRLFTIYERKPRQIAAAPFRDRVVHHALMNIVEPLLDPHFIYDSYACRKNKGVHQAVARYQGWARRYHYALKLDIQRYFPSIDHEILLAKIARHIKDRSTLALFDTLIRTSPIYPDNPPRHYPGDDLFTPVQRRIGIPIGNLTSQFLANLYLNAFDHFMCSELRVPAYLRYVDDMIVLDNDKSRLHDIRYAAEDFLRRERLRLHPRKAQVVPVRQGLDVLGYRVFPDFRLLRNDNGHRFNRRLQRFVRHYRQTPSARWDDFQPQLASWLGHACHADTLGLRKRIFSGIVLNWESGNTPTG